MAGAHRDGVLEVRHRIVQPRLCRQDQSEIVVRIGETRVDFEGALVLRCRFYCFACRGEAVTQGVVMDRGLQLASILLHASSYRAMQRLPAAFLAHGSPMSALGGDSHAAALRAFGARYTAARAILVISAHWQVSQPVRVTAWDSAPLIYDFGGFPDELYSLTYPAPGSPISAARVVNMLKSAGQQVRFESERGLDHGAWTPLRLAWPEATIPVIEVSMPFVPPQELFQLGKALRPLRDDGFLLVASGGIVHNLSRVRLADKNAPPDSWAVEFDSWVARAVAERKLEDLLAYRNTAPHARLSVPTTEHFDPLFVAMGMAYADEPVETIYEGMHYGNLSMRSFSFVPPSDTAQPPTADPQSN
jgi:4,5-DOPA dioxygenase extradiol